MNQINGQHIKEDFVQLNELVNNKPFVYLDSAATTLKPKQVIEAIDRYYLKECSNIHRGIHHFSELSTEKYENTRKIIKNFINAKEEAEIIFTRGTTESINLVARTFGENTLKKDDEILITYLEHHSNIVPWQLLCEKTGAKLKVAPINDKGEIILEEFKKLLSKKTKICSFNWISNSLGTVNPVKQMTLLAKTVDAVVLIDAAQAMAHETVDVQRLDCDLLVFSGHKMFGPTGIGVLYGKKDILETFPPFHGGGDMIDKVTFEKTTFNDLPQRLEAGTPSIASGIALGTAIEYINELGLENIKNYENHLLQYGTEKLSTIPNLKIIGTAENKSAVISFTIKGLHPQDLATYVNKHGIAIRTGHHCTQPIMDFFGVSSTARASFSVYNTTDDIDKLYESILKAQELFC